jgi:hypothetical protein
MLNNVQRLDTHSCVYWGLERSLCLHMGGCYGTMRQKFVLQLQAKWPSFVLLLVHKLPHNTFCLVSRWVLSQIAHHSGFYHDVYCSDCFLSHFSCDCLQANCVDAQSLCSNAVSICRNCQPIHHNTSVLPLHLLSWAWLLCLERCSSHSIHFNNRIFVIHEFILTALDALFNYNYLECICNAQIFDFCDGTHSLYLLRQVEIWQYQ